MDMMSSFETSGDGDSEENRHPSALAASLFGLTVVFLMVLMFSVSYTYGHLLPTLCMIEAPETEAYVPVATIEHIESSSEDTNPPAYTEAAAPKPARVLPEDLDAEGETDGDAEILLIRNKPFTASIRQTILHLRARGGYWSRFRGLSMFMAWNVVGGIIVSFLGAALQRSKIGVAIATIVAETLIATFHMAWVHIVISEPSQKRWYQRIPSFRTWPKIAPAVALWATTNQMVVTLPMLVCGSFGPLRDLKHPEPEYDPSQKDLIVVAVQGLLGLILTVALFVLLQIPASVALVRVAASMLPEEDETIVPFDRTFGGKTTPQIIGGKGKIGLVEAWRSFPGASRVRLLKLMAKIAAIFVVCWILATVVLVAEAHLLFGDKLGEVMKLPHRIIGGH